MPHTAFQSRTRHLVHRRPQTLPSLCAVTWQDPAGPTEIVPQSVFNHMLNSNLRKLAKPSSKKQLGTKLRVTDKFLTTQHVVETHLKPSLTRSTRTLAHRVYADMPPSPRIQLR